MFRSPHRTLSGNPRSALVTPESGMQGRKGHCADWPDCSCYKARFYTASPSCCGLPIKIGHCIQPPKVMHGPWGHVLCPNQTSDRGIATIQRSFIKSNRLLENDGPQHSSVRRKLTYEPSDNSRETKRQKTNHETSSEYEHVPATATIPITPTREDERSHHDETYPFTDEQLEIIDYWPDKGQIVCVNALA